MAVALAAGCSDDGGSGAQVDDAEVTGASIKAALVDAGLPCDGTPEPYKAEEGAIELGDNPVEELLCGEEDGDRIEVSVWGSANKRGVSMTMATSMICGFGFEEFGWVELGPATLSAMKADDETDFALNDKIAAATGGEAVKKTCDEE